MATVDYMVDAIFGLVEQAKALQPEKDSIQPMSEMEIIKFGEKTEGGFNEHCITVGCTGWSVQGTGGIGTASVQHYRDDFGVYIPKTYQITLLINSTSPTIVTAIAEYLYDVLIVLKSRISKAVTINAIAPGSLGQNDRGWSMPLNIFISSSLKIYADHIEKVIDNIVLREFEVS